MLYALFSGCKLLCLYNNEEQCKLMAFGLCQHQFVNKKDLSIEVFENNSIYQPNVLLSNLLPNKILNQLTENVDDLVNNLNESNDESLASNSEYNNSSDSSDSEEDVYQEKLNELYQTDDFKKADEERIALHNKIKELKQKKQRLEEKKTEYDVDIDLYYKFKQMKIDDENFIIPELFQKKNLVMSMLEKEGKLDFENFIENYTPDILPNSYKGLFNKPEIYENYPKEDDVESDSSDNTTDTNENNKNYNHNEPVVTEVVNGEQ